MDTISRRKSACRNLIKTKNVSHFQPICRRNTAIQVKMQRDLSANTQLLIKLISTQRGQRWSESRCGHTVINQQIIPDRLGWSTDQEAGNGQPENSDTTRGDLQIAAEYTNRAGSNGANSNALALCSRVDLMN